MSERRAETARLLRRDGSLAVAARDVAVEAPVAIEINGLGYAVMMATPSALDAFAVGFLLTERLIDSAADLIDQEVVETPDGLLLRATLAARVADRIGDRVRHRTGDTSCGLCGIAGLEQLRRPVLPAPPPATDAAALFRALDMLRDRQPLHRATGAAHAAAACARDGTIMAVAEDVGRHNALDKVIGRLALDGAAVDGFLLVTSRLSFEMVDKALVARAPLLAGISAPTSLAIDHARTHRLSLVALARPDSMLVMADPYGRFGQDP